MKSYDVVLIPGDGIGPEVSDAAREVLEAAGINIRWQVFDAGIRAQEQGKETLPPELLKAVRETGAALKGPLTTPVGSGFTSVNVRLRRELDLYANLRPVKTLPGTRSLYPDVDLIVVRENTEGLYIAEETWEDKNTVSAVKRVTREASSRIARFALEYARQYGRQSITAVHKANILKESDGLFLTAARDAAADYPEITFKDRIVDAMCLDLVLDPGVHDLLLCPNLYGDILSDLAAGLVGGLGTVPGANLGKGCAVFEAVHGSAPDIAGRGIANPTALILAGAMLLRHLGEDEAAVRVENAVHAVYASGEIKTPDQGGSATTDQFSRALIEHLDAPHL